LDNPKKLAIRFSKSSFIACIRLHRWGHAEIEVMHLRLVGRGPSAMRLSACVC
jgi:hypothetical protein